MSVTVFGNAAQVGGVSCQRSRHGTLLRAHSYDELLVDLGAIVPVDLDHDGKVVGEMVYGELDGDTLHAVAVLDGDEIAQLTEPIFFSPDLLAITDRGLRSFDTVPFVALRSLALTFRTARLGAHPVTVLSGDVRDVGDRARWEASWRWHHPLLNRCVNELDGRRRMPTLVRRAVLQQDDGPVPAAPAGPARPRPVYDPATGIAISETWIRDAGAHSILGVRR